MVQTDVRLVLRDIAFLHLHVDDFNVLLNFEFVVAAIAGGFGLDGSTAANLFDDQPGGDANQCSG